MKRWAWNIFCALSLMVFAPGAVLLVRSYFVGDIFGHTEGNVDKNGVFNGKTVVNYGMMFARGQMLLSRWHYDYPECRLPSDMLIYSTSPPDALLKTGARVVDFEMGGFVISHRFDPIGKGVIRMRWIDVPLWLFLSAAIPPILWWRKWRKRGGRGFPVSVTAASDASGDREDAKTDAKG